MGKKLTNEEFIQRIKNVNPNIKLLRIPYWEFNNIEEILEKELNKNN